MKEGSAEPRKVSGEAVALWRPLPFRSWPIDTAPSFPPCTCPAPCFRFRAWRHRLWVLKYPGVKGCCVWSVLGDCSSVMVHRQWQRRGKQRPSSLFSSWITGKVQSHPPRPHLSIWPEAPPEVYCGRWRCAWRLTVSLSQAGDGACLPWVLEWTQGFSSLYLLDLPGFILGILCQGERRNVNSIPNFAHYSKSRAPCESSILVHFNFSLWKISNKQKIQTCTKGERLVLI